MQLLKSLLFLVFLISICSNINGQDCINYPDLNGAPCKDCAPAGWIPDNMFLIYPHIIPPVAAPLPETNCTWLSNFSGPSPAGGNVVLLIGDDSNPDITSIETTIFGLNTNVTYTFGIYWEGISADCAINDYHDGILRVYIEDVLYEFEGATEWELAEVCFVPTSSTVKILLTTYEPGSHSAIIVDGNFDCSIAEQCCTLLPTNEEESYATCPGESITLETGYLNAIGSVQVEWTCDPPEGLSYLSSTNIESPEFIFPSSDQDFAGGTFKYTLNLEDDICVQTIECIEVNVVPSIAPVFELEFCDLDLVAQLPT
ncbi:MAG: hypothetical protein P1U56_24510, partial [Saprospiraceae bacterium]|nr:hypothetical protein [Saprospiraceae bacterium]